MTTKKHPEMQYLDYMQDMIDKIENWELQLNKDRTWVGTYRETGWQMIFDLEKWFPLLTSKKVYFHWVITELIWFIRWDTNIKFLVDNNVSIWSAWKYEDYQKFYENHPQKWKLKKINSLKEFEDEIIKDKLFAENFWNLWPVYWKQWRRASALEFLEKPKILNPEDDNYDYKFEKSELDFSSNKYWLVWKTFNCKVWWEFKVIWEFFKEKINKKWKLEKNPYLKIEFQDWIYGKTSVLYYQFKNKFLNGKININNPFKKTVYWIWILWTNYTSDEYNKFFTTWALMLRRCYDESDNRYENYWWKWVFVCKRWHIFENFVQDIKNLENFYLKELYPNKYSLDKDFYWKNYYWPDSCRWSSTEEQMLLKDWRKIYFIEDLKNNKQIVFLSIKEIEDFFNIQVSWKTESLKKHFEKRNDFKLIWIKEIKNNVVNWFLLSYKEVDQLNNAIQEIKTNPNSRRIIVNSWNLNEIDKMRIPPCHMMYQFFVNNGKLDLHLYQRSADMFLGIPFNVSSYAILIHIVAKLTGLKPWKFVHSIWDRHIYSNHIEQVKEQLSRKDNLYEFPTLTIKDRWQKTLEDFEIDDFIVENYQSHPTIKAPVAV